MKILCVIPLAGVLVAGPVWACGGIGVEDARIMESPPGAGVLAGYATLRNRGDTDMNLTGADSPEFALVEFHSITQGEPTTRMRAEKELTIPAHGSLVFSPWKLHMMLFRPRKDYHAGDSVMLNLHCDRDRQAVAFPVKAR